MRRQGFLGMTEEGAEQGYFRRNTETKHIGKKLVKGFACGLVAATMLAGCSRTDDNQSGQQGSVDNSGMNQEAQNGENQNTGNEGSVYYLSFKPESDEIWKQLAAAYTQETGVEVKVVTAANNTYEQTLMSEISNKEAPTLFQINGPVGYQSWKDYCADLSETNLYSWLMDKSLAIKGEDGGVYGIPYVVEGYGIIYNDAIMQKYFATEKPKVTSVEEINNFNTLKAVVEDMQAKKDELGIKGVFASTSLNPGDDWRWQSHLANVPFSYEMDDKDVSTLYNFEFTYAEAFKNIFDLYLDNSCTAPGLLGAKSVDDSMAEFALGQVAMVQNGNWAWGQISEVEGNVVAEENIKFLPIYTGVEDEEEQGLCIGTENYFAINAKASSQDQAASIAFVEWIFSSETGKDIVTNQLGFIAPFDTFQDEDRPADPLAREVIRYMEDTSKENIAWNFTMFPSVRFKEDFGAALLEYASGSMGWNEVKARVVQSWAVEMGAN